MESGFQACTDLVRDQGTGPPVLAKVDTDGRKHTMEPRQVIKLLPIKSLGSDELSRVLRPCIRVGTNELQQKSVLRASFRFHARFFATQLPG